MSKGQITKNKKKKLKKELKNTNINKSYQSDLKKKEIEELKEKLKTKGMTAGEIIGIIFAVVLGIPFAIILLIIITFGILASISTSAAHGNLQHDFGKKITKKNRFFKKINNQIKKDYIKAIKRRKKLKFNKSDRKKIKEIQKKLSKKGYTKIEIAGIMISIVMKIPVKVGIQYVSNLVKKIVK